MDYFRTKQHQMLYKTIDDFCEKEVDPISVEIDQKGRFPKTTFAKLGKNGFLGILIPKEYKGSGGDIYSFAIILSTLAKTCGAIAISYAVHTLASYCFVYKYGSPLQKNSLLPLMANGEKIGAVAITEPFVGSDAAGIETVAEVKENNYILNGEKAYIVNAPIAGVLIVMASWDKRQGKKGINAFLIITPNAGVSTRLNDTMGMRGSVISNIVIKNCILPKENLLGSDINGYEIMMSVIEFDRIGAAITAGGIAEGALNASIEYSKKRFQFGKSISHFQAIQFKLADMATNLMVTKAFIGKILDQLSVGNKCKMEASMSKLFATEMAVRMALDAIQIHGGYGYTRSARVERYLRDAKGLCIGAGTSEIQRMIIGREILKYRKNL